MHDPYTLVFCFLGVQVWHRDAHGSDGACGWSYPHLSAKQSQACKDLGFWEARERHFLRYPFKSYSADVADREALYRALLLTIARVIRVPLSIDEATKIASEKNGLGGCEGIDHVFCFVPGYHTNYKEDTPEGRADHWTQVCHSIARSLLRMKRRWWQHPRWHFWHWRFSVPALKWSNVK
jgi:hypothetical protein